MDFEVILNEVRPDESDKKEVGDLIDKIINQLNSIIKDKDLDSEAVLVGSVAKDTWLKGKADIDIFLTFSLNILEDDLKRYGLEIAHECINLLGGEYEERYASHPYVTGFIEGYSVDIVPCYKMNVGNHIVSAVDRTVLHTKYINNNISPGQTDEILLLKKFMESIETYGSEFKVGGFAGYLCELLILKYGTFLGVLKAANKWKKHTVIDLEDYGTCEQFDDPLIVIDPVDKNRNVAASLSLQKMAEFMGASRNFLREPKIEYFQKADKFITLRDIFILFNVRSTETYILKFKPPKIPEDTLYPQLRKTEKSLSTKLTKEGFSVFKTSSWTDAKDLAIIMIEVASGQIAGYKNYLGPRIWDNDFQENFIEKHNTMPWIEGDRWVVRVSTVGNIEGLIKNLFTPENIHLLKVGKNIKKELLENYSFMDINKFLLDVELSEDLSEFFSDFLIPGQNLFR